MRVLRETFYIYLGRNDACLERNESNQTCLKRNVICLERNEAFLERNDSNQTSLERNETRIA